MSTTEPFTASRIADRSMALSDQIKSGPRDGSLWCGVDSRIQPRVAKSLVTAGIVSRHVLGPVAGNRQAEDQHARQCETLPQERCFPTRTRLFTLAERRQLAETSHPRSYEQHDAKHGHH